MWLWRLSWGALGGREGAGSEGDALSQVPAGWAEGRPRACSARPVGRSLGATSLGTAAGRQMDLSPSAPSGCSCAGKANPGSAVLPEHFSELALAIGQPGGESGRLTNAPGNRPGNRRIAT